jgi:hypothetical protein
MGDHHLHAALERAAQVQREFLPKSLPDLPRAQVAAMWRQQQLEYTWRRSAMGRYVDFAIVTAHALQAALAAARLYVSSADQQQICHITVPSAASQMQGCEAAVISSGQAQVSALAYQYLGSLEAVHEAGDVEGCPRASAGNNGVDLLVDIRLVDQRSEC